MKYASQKVSFSPKSSNMATFSPWHLTWLSPLDTILSHSIKVESLRNPDFDNAGFLKLSGYLIIGSTMVDVAYLITSKLIRHFTDKSISPRLTRLTGYDCREVIPSFLFTIIMERATGGHLIQYPFSFLSCIILSQNFPVEKISSPNLRKRILILYLCTFFDEYGHRFLSVVAK